MKQNMHLTTYIVLREASMELSVGSLKRIIRCIIFFKILYNLIQKQILQIHIGPNNLVIEPYINASQTRLN